MAPVRQNCLALDSATTHVSYLSKGSLPQRGRGKNQIVYLEHCPATALEIHNAAEITEGGCSRLCGHLVIALRIATLCRGAVHDSVRRKGASPASPADARCPFCPAIGTSDILRGPARPACHRAGMLASADCSGSGSAAGVSDSGRITCFCTSSAARRCARIVCLALFASRITIHSNISRCAGITLSTRPLSSATSSRIPTSKSWIESSNSVRSGLCAVWARRL
jgi:hypothetical protein